MEEHMGRLRNLPALVLCLIVTLGISLVIHGQGKGPVTVTPSDYLRWPNELKNWGRWGPNDQRGTSNLITESKVLSATRLVKSGIVVSLARPVPQQTDAETPASAVFHRTTNNISDTNTTDNYQVSYHGLTVSHMHAFCHFFFEGK